MKFYGSGLATAPLMVRPVWTRTTALRTGVGQSGLDEFVQQIFWDGFPGLVVLGHPLQRLLLPDPVLQHLGRRLHEVPLHVRPAEHGVVRLQNDQNRCQGALSPILPCVMTAPPPADLGAELMHDVSELVEVRLHLVVLQQRRGVRRGLAEVGHHGRHRHLPRTVGPQATGLQAEAGGVAVLPLPAGGDTLRSTDKGSGSEKSLNIWTVCF